MIGDIRDIFCLLKCEYLYNILYNSHGHKSMSKYQRLPYLHIYLEKCLFAWLFIWL